MGVRQHDPLLNESSQSLLNATQAAVLDQPSDLAPAQGPRRLHQGAQHPSVQRRCDYRKPVRDIHALISDLITMTIT
ncbi:MAG: hypothetical protein ACYDDU_19160 [Dermatophilaceae bacterium]